MPRDGDAPGGVGVVGLGVVGETVATAFGRARVPVRVYDLYRGIGAPGDLAPCEAVFLCLPTPLGADGGLDVGEIVDAADAVAPHLQPGTVLANKSTVPPGTADRLAGRHPAVHVAAVPEFLVEARALETFTRPDRVVVGTRSPQAAAVLTGLFEVVAPGAPVVLLSPAEAELAKLCANALLAAKVTLANELAEACAAFGVEWDRIQEAVGMDRRIGPHHLTVTRERGFAGRCLPKDVDGLIAAASEAGYPAPLLREVAEFNRRIRGAARSADRGPAAEELRRPDTR